MTKTESVIQREGSTHHEETETVERQMASEPKFKPKVTPEEAKQAMSKKVKKIPLKEKTYEALEQKPKAESTTPDQKAAEIVEEKAKGVFKGKINKYGFLHFSKDLMETLGWTKGEDIAVRITRTANGIAVERA